MKRKRDTLHKQKLTISKIRKAFYQKCTFPLLWDVQLNPLSLQFNQSTKHNNNNILNKDVPIQEAKTDKFKLLSLSFDEDMTKLSYNEQKEKFKSVNYKEIGYPIDLTSKYIERLFTQKIEEKPKEEKNVQLPKETTTTIRIDQPPMGGIINMKLALMVFFVSIFISYYLVNKYI